MSALTISVTGLAVLFAAMLAPFLLGRADLIGKGRVLSRPLWRFPPFRPIRLGPHVRTGHIRGAQLFFLAVLAISIAFGMRSAYASWVYDFGGAACYLDDLLTGDDDRWNGLRRRVRRLLAYRPRLRARTPVLSPA